jgi:hypothetical protein
VLNALRKNAEVSDVVFVVGKERIFAHRCVIANRSKPLMSMLYGKWKESNSSELVLSDPNITPSGFQYFLDYLYTNITSIEAAHVYQLRYLADLYDVPTLFQQCDKWLENKVSNKNVLEILNQAIKLNDTKTIEKGKQLIEAQTMDVLSKSRNYLSSIKEDIVLMILKSNQLSIPEVELFLWLVDWYLKTESNNSKLFSYIRYGRISQTDLITKVRPAKLAPQDLYIFALEYHASPLIISTEMPQSQLEPRGNLELLQLKQITDITVTGVSSHHSHFVKENTLSKKLDAYWLSQNSKTANQWISYCFSKKYCVLKLRLGFYNCDCHVKDFKLQTSQEGENWMDVQSFSTFGRRAGGNEWQDFEGFKVHTKFIRLFLLNVHGTTDGDYILLSSVEFWGKEST